MKRILIAAALLAAQAAWAGPIQNNLDACLAQASDYQRACDAKAFATKQDCVAASNPFERSRCFDIASSSVTACANAARAAVHSCANAARAAIDTGPYDLKGCLARVDAKKDHCLASAADHARQSRCFDIAVNSIAACGNAAIDAVHTNPNPD